MTVTEENMNIKKGDIVEFQIEKYAFEGKGIAKVSKNEMLGLELKKTVMRKIMLCLFRAHIQVIKYEHDY